MKKLLSLVLVVVMMFSALSIVANAEAALTYNGHSRIVVTEACTFNPDNFSVALTLNENKVAAFDGESDSFTYEITAIKTPDDIDYNTNPEEFFAHFTAEGKNVIFAPD